MANDIAQRVVVLRSFLLYAAMNSRSPIFIYYAEDDIVCQYPCVYMWRYYKTMEHIEPLCSTDKHDNESTHNTNLLLKYWIYVHIETDV